MTEPALIAATHGTRSAAGRAVIDELRASASAARPGLEVVEAYVDEDVQRPGLVEALSARRAAVVVPILLSAGYHVHHDVADAVAAAGIAVTAARPLGPDHTLVDVLADRVGASAADEIVLAAAGSSDPRAGEDVRWTAARLGERLGKSVRPAFLTADQPRVDALLKQLAGSRVTIASYVLAPGHFHDQLLSAGADFVTPPLLPDARITELVLRRYDEARAS